MEFEIVSTEEDVAKGEIRIRITEQHRLSPRASNAIPDLLRPFTPSIGSLWMWEPLKPHARCEVVVTEVKWNGEDVMIEAAPPASHGVFTQRVWNSLDRWVEAAVMIRPAQE